MTASPAAPYETLCDLAERELELIGEGRLEPLADLHTRRTELIATLPPTPPPAARPALERCGLLQRRVQIELLRVREALLLELADVDRGQRAANGYKPPNAGPRVTARA